MTFWLYNKTTAQARQISRREADREGRNGADAGSRSDFFVVEATTRDTAIKLAQEWIVAEDDVGDMILVNRYPDRHRHGRRCYAYLTRL